MEPIKTIKKIYITPLSAMQIAFRLTSGEAELIGKRAERGSKQAMRVITSYIRWQRFQDEDTQTAFEQSYLAYKKKANEKIV
jgi:hypothetical protein